MLSRGKGKREREREHCDGHACIVSAWCVSRIGKEWYFYDVHTMGRGYFQKANLVIQQVRAFKKNMY